jgi:hypothetical protein
MVAVAKAPEAFQYSGQLLEEFMPVRLELIEGRADGKLVMRGEFARAGVATENKRLYTAPLWERELRRLDRALTERRVFGELDHPSDGRTQLQRVSHIVTGLRLENGVVIGEAEIMNTERGRDLKAILEAGARVGVSSRGYGSTVTNDKGQEVVQEDYKLVTFDFVAEPANVTSYPERVKDQKEEDMAVTNKKEPAPEKVVESSEADLDAKKEEFANIALQVFANEREKIREEERENLLADPDVAGAKATLEQVLSLVREQALPQDAEEIVKAKDEEIARLKNEVAERDLKIAGLEEEVDKVSSVAREVGYKFFLEKHLSETTDAKMLRSMIGEVRQYESPEEILSKLESCKGELAARRSKLEAVERRKQRELDVLAEDKSKVNERLSKTEAALEKAVELNQALSLELYTNKRLENHPRAKDLRESLRRMSLTSKEEVDQVISESTEVPQQDPDSLERVRSRVRNATQGGLSQTPLEEEQGPQGPTNGNSTNYNGLGVSLGELRALAELSNN